MKRLHNTNFKEIRLNKTYSQTETDFKPKGLWYAIDDEWLQWCSDNMVHWIKKYLFELDIDISQLLIISTQKELNIFNEKYKLNLYERIGSINWDSVKKDYKGIEIINYNNLKYSHYNDNTFYSYFYGWDVSGGCIWDLSIINNTTKYPITKIYETN